jgi:hypothetical protein
MGKKVNMATNIDQSERRPGMANLTGRVEALSSKVSSLFGELHILMEKFSASCQAVEKLSNETLALDHDIRGNGEPGLNQRIARLETSVNGEGKKRGLEERTTTLEEAIIDIKLLLKGINARVGVAMAALGLIGTAALLFAINTILQHVFTP